MNYPPFLQDLFRLRSDGRAEPVTTPDLSALEREIEAGIKFQRGLCQRADGRATPIDPVIEAARTMAAHGAEQRRIARRQKTAEHIAAIQALAHGPRPDPAVIEAELDYALSERRARRGL